MLRNPLMLRQHKPAELLLVPMIDIFTVLVTFLLMTAVFSRIAILQVDLPSSSGNKPTEPTFRLEVIVRKEGYELTDGKQVFATIPKVNGAYDLRTLSEQAQAVKHEHPDANDASVLAEPKVPYDELIQVMDAIRSMDGSAPPQATGLGAAVLTARTAPPAAAAPQASKVAMFTNIAVGDAP